MINPSSNSALRLPPVKRARRAWAILCREVIGLAQDYWKDGHSEPRAPKAEQVKPKKANVPAAPRAEKDPSTNDVLKTGDGLWHAQPGEISERMWGKGYVTPADEYMTELMITPLGITKDMSLLDLAAGLGGRLRKTTDDFGVYINGLEPDPEIAARGMAISVAAGRSKRASIAAYDPMNLVEQRLYDCIIARETIYRVADKEKFIKAIVSCCKPKAQISFTDYIVNPEVHDQPAILAWRAFEKDANPVGLVDMAEMWAKAGISIRVHDDQTEFYKKEVKKGLVRFARFMATGVKPDAATRKSIEKRITTWAHRVAAMEQGMKLYRFYGLR